MAEGGLEARTNKRLVLSQFGGLNRFRLHVRKLTAVRDGYVRIKVEACSINVQDVLNRQGSDPSVIIKPPCVLGMEVAGRIDECGRNVTTFEVGDRVIGLVWSGGWSQYVSCHVDWVFRMPAQMTFAEAASISVSYLTAHYLLFEFGNLKEGKNVFCHNATGDIGIAVGQLCKSVDNVTLYGICPPAQVTFAQQNGYHHLAQERNYIPDMQQLVPNGFDIMIDAFRGPFNRRNFELTSRMGKYIMHGGDTLLSIESHPWIFTSRWWNPFQKDLFTLMSESKTIGGFILSHLAQDPKSLAWMRSTMTRILEDYNNSIITPIIDCVYRLEEYMTAMQQVHHRPRIGKILFSPNMADSQGPHKHITRGDVEELALPQKLEHQDAEKYHQEELIAGLSMAPRHSDEADDDEQPTSSTTTKLLKKAKLPSKKDPTPQGK